MTDIWAGVDRLVERASSLAGLRAHRIQLLAARRWRALGRDVPAELAADERRAAIAHVTTPLLLRRIRDTYDGPLVVLKGIEVAARYPTPGLRPFHDIDILVPDAHEAQRALLSSGFEEGGRPEFFEGLHHLRPVDLPRFPLWVEVHSRPNWLAPLEPPSSEELFAVAVPSSCGIDGVSTLPAPYHALVLAVHAWSGEKRTARLSHFIDVAAMCEGVDERELAALARRFGLTRLWATTTSFIDLLLGDPETSPSAPWGTRYLSEVREPTVSEVHLQRWLRPFWTLPPGRALRRLPSVAREEVAPSAGELASKIGRTAQTIRNVSSPLSEHEQRLGRRFRPGSRRR
ncbi:MAG: nucleotidyltransferase family protein [Gaiellaceae bacterium]